MPSTGTGGDTKLNGWPESFDWSKGSMLEVEWEGEWWKCTVRNNVAEDGGRVQVHYTGGKSGDCEWMDSGNPRLRPLQRNVGAKGRAVACTDESDKDMKGCGDADRKKRKLPECIEAGDCSAAPGDRPKRQSRIVSENLRFAQGIQDAEVMAACRQKKVAVKDKPLQVEEPEERAVTKPRGKGGGKALAQQPSAAKGKGQAARKRTAGTKGKGSIQEKRPGTQADGDQAKAPPSLQKIKPDPPGHVLFVLNPMEGKGEPLPAMRKAVLTMPEDTTIQQIKRMVTDSVLPGGNPGDLVIRTPAGMQLGNDHSLKFVRLFLWPSSKGKLCLTYAKEAKTFL